MWVFGEIWAQSNSHESVAAIFLLSSAVRWWCEKLNNVRAYRQLWVKMHWDVHVHGVLTNTYCVTPIYRPIRLYIEWMGMRGDHREAGSELELGHLHENIWGTQDIDFFKAQSFIPDKDKLGLTLSITVVSLYHMSYTHAHYRQLSYETTNTSHWHAPKQELSALQ